MFCLSLSYDVILIDILSRHALLSELFNCVEILVELRWIGKQLAEFMEIIHFLIHKCCITCPVKHVFMIVQFHLHPFKSSLQIILYFVRLIVFSVLLLCICFFLIGFIKHGF